MIDRPDFGRTKVIGGRQRIVLDDQRFIGNVGWRQNEQTYDGVWAQSGFLRRRLTRRLRLHRDVHRIFGDQGPPATQDYDSNSHLARVAYDVAPWFQPVAFAYLLDLRQSPVNSSNTYGLRATGTAPIGEDWSVTYQGTLRLPDRRRHERRQTIRPTTARTTRSADLARRLPAARRDRRRLRAARQRRRTSRASSTPLATAHKFTGWADAIDNVGAEGIQDALRVRLARRCRGSSPGR